MDTHKNILVVTNSIVEEEIIQIKNAFFNSNSEKKDLNIKLSLVHVMPTLPSCYFNIPSMVLLAERYYEEAKNSLTDVGQQLNISPKDQWLVTGRMRREVLQLANKLNTDFILASSKNINDLRASSLFNKEQHPTVIKDISHITQTSEILIGDAVSG